MEIYLDLVSPPCRAVYLFAEALKIPYAFKLVELSAGQQYSEEFGKLSVVRKVPVLKDGSFVLTESIAILQYLVQKCSVADHWFPAELQQRARVNEYLSWQHLNLRSHCSKVFLLRTLYPFVMGSEAPKDKMDAALEDMKQSLDLLDEKFLQDKPFIVGNKISVADVAAMVEIMQPLGVGVDGLQGRPKLAAWRERVKKEVGVKLFDQAHEALLNASGLQQKMQNNTELQKLKPMFLKTFVMGSEAPKDKLDATLEDMKQSLDLLEEKFLQDKPFIVGNKISLADLVAMVEIMQPLGVGVDPFHGRPKLTAWRERVKKELGVKLFDQAHEALLNLRGIQQKMQNNTEIHKLKPMFLKYFR